MLRFFVIVLFGSSFLFSASSMSQDFIYKDPESGRVLTVDDLKLAEGEIQWEIPSERPVPEDAKALHQMGRSAGQSGDYSSALSYFDKASKLAPDWPYPLYDAAFTYLLMGDFENAFAHYRRVDEMAPRGFFTVKTAVDVLRKEETGELPQGIYLHFVGIEGETDPKKEYELLTALTERFPDFAPAWQKLADLEDDDRKKLAAINKGLDASPDPETKGFLLVNKAIIFANSGDQEGAIGLLGPMILDPMSPRDIEAIAKQTLAMILDSE